MLTPSIINLLAFFYPIGNTPAVSLTQYLPSKQHADILLLGCGDVRNILFTTYCDGGSPPTSLDITCCDAERSIIGRNVLLLATLLDDIDGKNHASIWQMYYHLFIDSKSLDLVQSQAEKLLNCAETLESWNSSTYGNVFRFYDQESLDAVKMVWKSYEPTDSNDLRFKGTFKKAKDAKMDYIGKGMTTLSFRSAAPANLEAMNSLSKLYVSFWKHGTTDASDSKIAEQTHPNPMFAPLEWDTINLHYATDPHIGFPLATAYVPLTEDSPLRPKPEATADYGVHQATKVARQHFLKWSKSFRKQYDHLIIRFFVGDALTFCHTLQGKRISGRNDSHFYRSNYSLKPLVLRDDGLDLWKSAPVSFDTIDTSNLFDHLGAINVLIATTPLLNRSVSATLYTESLVLKENNLQELSEKLLCGHFPTMSVLLNLVPVDFWTNATAVSSAHEVAFNERLKTTADSAEVDPRAINGQMHCRMAWKGAVPAPGTTKVQRLLFIAEDLAFVMFQVYQEMFQHENVQTLTSPPNVITALNNSSTTYHRGTFASLLKFIKPKVNVDWGKMMEILLDLIQQDTSTMLGRVYVQELYLHLHHFEVYSIPTFKPGFRHAKPKDFKEGLGGWKNIPAGVCLTVEVPRAKLEMFTDMRLSELSTPLLHAMVQSSDKAPRKWKNIFADVHLAFGKIVCSGKRNQDNYSVTVEEDPEGWKGNSPLIACFYVPTSILLYDPKDAEVVFGIQSTPQSVRTFRELLGWKLDIVSFPLKKNESVHISKYAPNHSGYPLPAQSAMDVSQLFIAEQSVTIIASLEGGAARIRAMTGRVHLSEEDKILIRHGARVRVLNKTPFSLSIKVEDSEQTYKVRFPGPVVSSRSKLDVVPSVGFIDVIAPLADARKCNELPFFMYPIFLSKGEVTIVNMPHVKLHRMPIIDVSQTERIQWLIATTFLQLSARERYLRDNSLDRNIRHEDARTSLKDSLFSIFMHFTGLREGAKTSSFAVFNPSQPLAKILIFINSLRLDLANQTVVLDANILTVTNGIRAKIDHFLTALSESNVCEVKVDDNELRLWKQLLPVAVERCREWEHLDSCEYKARRKIPLSLEKGYKFLCSCSFGLLPEGFTSCVEGWDVARKHAVRAAIPPTFSVPYVDPPAADGRRLTDSASIRRCGNCGRLEISTGLTHLKCGRCVKVWYCSRDCQRADWKEHKRLCKPKTVNLVVD